ncbi:hypothetical protein [Prevotella sp. KH2C16]|nr:hypothetical protein [Prevotella sp. KH2C16]
MQVEYNFCDVRAGVTLVPAGNMGMETYDRLNAHGITVMRNAMEGWMMY